MTESASEVRPDASESTLSTWFWDCEVSAIQMGFAKPPYTAAGRRQAHGLETQTAIHELGSDVAELIDELKRSGICTISDGRIAFAHDLIGDWVRHQLLLSHGDQLASYLASRSDYQSGTARFDCTPSRSSKVQRRRRMDAGNVVV